MTAWRVASNDEAVDPWFLIGSSSVWNGITMGAIDIAKRHTTRKRHVDVGMRVADYPTIQDYVGEAVMDTNSCRVFVMSVANAMDRVSVGSYYEDALQAVRYFAPTIATGSAKEETRWARDSSWTRRCGRRTGTS